MLDFSKSWNEIVDEISLPQFYRLLIIVGGYYFLRQRVQTELKRRQLKNQLLKDEQAKAEGLIERPEQEEELENLTQSNTGIKASEKGWGWGKTTRRKVQRQKELFEKQIEEAALRAQNGYDSDDEIKELLQ